MSNILSAEEIERGLTSPGQLRLVFARRTDYTPTPAQFERGLTDEHAEVRFVFARRTDYTPTPAQIERGLTDEYADIRRVFLRLKVVWIPRWEAEKFRKQLKKKYVKLTKSKPMLEAM